MSSTLKEKAVVGRRVEFAYYRDKHLWYPGDRNTDVWHPGIITALVPGQGASLKIRLDGKRSNLHVPPDYQGLRYLDEVLDPVPALPMGRFTPTVKELDGEWEGVLVCTVSEDGDILLFTTDRKAAVRAATAYFTQIGVDLNYVHFDRLKARWAVFEWEPEDAETDWTVTWSSRKEDDQAVHVYLLPA